MRSRYKLLRFICLLAIILLTACGRSENDQPVITVAELTGLLPIHAPDSALVGEEIDLTIGPVADATDGTPIVLTLIGSYGPNVLRSQFKNNQAHFLIPATMTTRSGLVDLIATSGGAKGNATLELLADKPVEPISPLVGARSIIADGDHWAMVVAIPFDRFGNPVAEGTPIDIRSLHPGKVLRTYDSKIEHLLAWERVYSGTKSGRTVIAVNIDDIHGPEGVLLEVPGWPVPFPIMSDPGTLPADGFQLMTLYTAKISDQFGNIMPDGTLVKFVVDGPVGNRRVIPAQTVDGVAETIFQAPNDPGVYTIRAAVFGMESDLLSIEFTEGPAVSEFPIAYTTDEEKGELVLTAGPITAALDQYVPDGTQVTFNLVGPDKKLHAFTGFTDGGYATGAIRLIHLTPGRQIVEANAGSGGSTLQFLLPE